jgi:uncharacterized protein (TIGR00369 family)
MDDPHPRLDDYRKIIASSGIHSPLGTVLGLRLVTADPGTATFELETKPELFNSVGTIQGGIIAVMADAAMGIAFGSLLDSNTGFTTIEFKINYIKSVKTGKIRAVGKTIHQGKKTGVVEAKIYDDKDQLIAISQGTMMTIAPKT